MRGVSGTLALVAALGLMFSSSNAAAATSADATIFNQAKLTYSGGSVTVGVSVKVALVGATPTLSTPADDSVTSGDVVEILYAITSNANGLDNYDLTTTQSNIANNTGTLQNAGILILAGDTGTTQITNLDLGAAITASPNLVANQISIPAGAEANLANDMYINLDGFGVYKIDTAANSGIVPGTVASIGNDGVETHTFVELLTTTDLPGDSLVTGSDFAIGAVAGGIQVGEIKQFRVAVTGGAFTGDSTSGTHTVTTSADPDTGAAVSAEDDVDIAVTAAAVSLTKDIALVTGADGAGNGGTVGAYTTTSFDVSPGDVLSYRITVGPEAGQPAIIDASIDDSVPAFTTYVTDSLRLNGIQVSTVNGTDGGTFPLDGGFAVNSPNSGSNDGSGNDGTGEAGVIDSGASAQLIFRVIVD
jgi:hypothetical protein